MKNFESRITEYRCTRCRVVRDAELFGIKREVKRGRKAHCKLCDQQMQRAADAKWKPEVLPEVRAWLLGKRQ